MADRSDSTMFFPEHDVDETPSEFEGMDLEDIPPLPTLERTSISSILDEDSAPSGSTVGSIIKQEPDTSFRPALDVPRHGNRGSRYNTIQSIKVEDSLNNEHNEEDVFVGASDTGKLRQTREGSSNAFKVEKNVTRRRGMVHNRALGPSMSKSAVDYRERKFVEGQYQAHFAELLDFDIVQGVDEEGGITPRGRIFKAGVRMLERVRRERLTRPRVSTDDVSSTDFELTTRLQAAEDKVAKYKSELEALVKRLE